MSENKRAIKKSTRGRTPDGNPNPIDVHVGNRIRLRRSLLGLSQEKLAELLGLTFQQVQKYERGMNRVGASRLWDLGRVLDTSIIFLFEDISGEVAGQSPRMFSLPAGETNIFEDIAIKATDPMQKAETYELVKDYYKIKNRELAKSIKETIHQASKSTYADDLDEDD